MKGDIPLPKDVKLKVEVFGQGLAVLRLSVTSFGGPVPVLGMYALQRLGDRNQQKCPLGSRGNVSSELMNRPADCDMVYPLVI